MGSVNADGNNHISGFTYDTRGNTTNDGTIAYTYDAESQIKTAAGVTYSYDGSGRRVSKSSNKLYWYGSGGEILAETDASGNTLNEYIFFGGKRVAILPSGGSAEYYVEDLLGSSRLMTSNNGTVCYDADFDPYGGEHTYTNSCSQNYKFEGKERDTETGNDDFGARYYTSRFGPLALRRLVQRPRSRPLRQPHQPANSQPLRHGLRRPRILRRPRRP